MSETFCKRILKLDKFVSVFPTTHDTPMTTATPFKGSLKVFRCFDYTLTSESMTWNI